MTAESRNSSKVPTKNKANMEKTRFWYKMLHVKNIHPLLFIYFKNGRKGHLACGDVTCNLQLSKHVVWVVISYKTLIKA